MNEYYYMYYKLRKEFGKYPNFEDTDAKILGAIDADIDKEDQYVSQACHDFCFDNIAEMSEHGVNTERIKTKNRSMLHVEGGWPKEVDYTEAQETTKWRKRIEKDHNFTMAVKNLTAESEKAINQNNTMDLFEDYFADAEEADIVQTEILNARTLALFKDQVEDTRSVSRLSWHPEGPTRIAASYSVLRFQKMADDMPKVSFIWDVQNPNEPVSELRTVSPLICCSYQPRNADLLAGGCYNGAINFYDLRKGEQPCETTVVSKQHWDPVYELTWLQSKTQSECVTVSSDARCIFWDTRFLSEPVDECVLTDGAKEEPKRLGGVSLEWMQEAGPTKYLVGTEQGAILSLNKKPKKDVEVGTWFGLESKGGSGGHFGPVYSTKRNPHQVKYFLTVGDWRAQLWMEELKGPLLSTVYHSAMLSAGAWSPTRAGLFFVTRTDGWLDCWDYFYRMNEVALSHRVTDGDALTSLSVQNQGKLVAVGDASGQITLLELCEGMVHPGPNEKNVIAGMMERETKREKNLEQARKAASVGKKAEHKKIRSDAVNEEDLYSRAQAFFKDMNISEDHSSFT
mmetsp:Transcript_114715/g.263321  ORF Transcript_114715/g.263321 Transcript_114715/m.263321 type:complete len:569 (+) Transcript_114715:42-1748(+)